METIPGFDVANVDQNVRQIVMQEQLNSSVMSKHVKILFMPNPLRQPLKEIVKKFICDVVKYDNKDDIAPMAWYPSAGHTGDITTFRAEVSFPFWEHFIAKGRNNLSNFNKANNTKIKLVRCQTLKRADIENLTLYLRQKIRLYCIEKNIVPPDMSASGAFLTIKDKRTNNTLKFKSTVLAITLGWEYNDWHGNAIKALMTPAELKNYQDGKIKWRSLKLENILQGATEPSTIRRPSISYEDGKAGRKRKVENKSEPMKKKPRHEKDGEEPIDVNVEMVSSK